MSSTPARKQQRFANMVKRRLSRRFSRAIIRRGVRGEAQLVVLRFLAALGASIRADQAVPVAGGKQP